MSGIDSTDPSHVGKQSTSVVLKPARMAIPREDQKSLWSCCCSQYCNLLLLENTLYLQVNPSNNAVKLFPNLDFCNHPLALHLEGRPLLQGHANKSVCINACVKVWGSWWKSSPGSHSAILLPNSIQVFCLTPLLMETVLRNHSSFVPIFSWSL